MAKEKDTLFRAKRGVAAMIVCVVQTMNETDPTFQERFIRRLERAYIELKDHVGDNAEAEALQELELLAGVRELLTGFSPDHGQAPS